MVRKRRRHTAACKLWVALEGGKEDYFYNERGRPPFYISASLLPVDRVRWLRLARTEGWPGVQVYGPGSIPSQPWPAKSRL